MPKTLTYLFFLLFLGFQPLVALPTLGNLYLLLEKSDNESRKALVNDPNTFKKLYKALQKQDPTLLTLVDKQNLLSANYVTPNLVSLDGLPNLVLNRKGHFLRNEVISSLQQMTLDAREQGVTLLISSAYRSYDYQDGLYKRWVRQLGQKQADRLSAPPGASQHQLGTAVDFGSVEASFNGTKAQLWLEKNAHRYGWSLSFPQNYEEETGYMYESWHYRYIGVEASQLQNQFFGGLQYKLLTSLRLDHRWAT